MLINPQLFLHHIEFNQFGFRKRFSTSHAIISLVEKIRQGTNSGKTMVGELYILLKSV